MAAINPTHVRKKYTTAERQIAQATRSKLLHAFYFLFQSSGEVK